MAADKLSPQNSSDRSTLLLCYLFNGDCLDHLCWCVEALREFLSVLEEERVAKSGTKEQVAFLTVTHLDENTQS